MRIRQLKLSKSYSLISMIIQLYRCRERAGTSQLCKMRGALPLLVRQLFQLTQVSIQVGLASDSRELLREVRIHLPKFVTPETGSKEALSKKFQSLQNPSINLQVSASLSTTSSHLLRNFQVSLPISQPTGPVPRKFVILSD